ncbi:transposase [Streptomyces olivoreticuli]
MPDRETGTVAAWLQAHPGAEIICRDRLMAFTKAIRQAAPDALEVADRWHLLQNLSTAVEKTCRHHRECLRRPAKSEASPPLATPETLLLDRIRQRHAEINELAATGLSLSVIGRRLSWTARRSGATGTRTWQGFSPRRRTAGTVAEDSRTPARGATAQLPSDHRQLLRPRRRAQSGQAVPGATRRAQVANSPRVGPRPGQPVYGAVFCVAARSQAPW